MITTNCSENIAIPSYSTIEIIAEAIKNVTITCNQFHLLITEDQRIFIQVKNTNAIAFTFIGCVLLLFFYSCCWFNRFNLCEAAATTPDATTRSAVNCDPAQSQTSPDGDSVTVQIDQTHSPEQPELSRRYDIDLESLPSYTICSGLPTYDDALDQFRKYGIIIQPPSVIKIFDESSNSKTEAENNDDNVSVNSTCTCGGGNNAPTPSTISFGQPNVIELNPDQLQLLSQKRLSLQIAVNSSIRRSGRSGRVDLCREVNRSNLLKSHDIPPIHRSASQQSLYHDRILSQRLRSLQHRGSLC